MSEVFLTDDDRLRGCQYHEVEPKYLGNLHERMRLVVEQAVMDDLNSTNHDLWHLIHDLQVEVKFIEPPNPPMARRVFGGAKRV